MDALDDVLGKLADGEKIDWDAIERAATPDELPLIQQLRVLEGVGETHRSTPLEASDPWQRNTVASTRDQMIVADGDRGRHWGRYRLVRLIGRGSYGAVYLAHDEDLKRDIAIKLLHKTVGVRADHAERVRAEGRALARMRDANVLAVYDVEEHEDQLGLCMEYVDGRTLDDIVRASGPMNADEAIVIGQAVCRGLAAIHAAGVLHRDVKARNVMRERAGRIVLMDLGSGLDEAMARTDLQNVGTPMYMSPELMAGAPATRQSDVYAVGVLMYYLATASYPVTGDSVEDLRRAHRERRRTPIDERRPDLPDAFVRIVERATATDPAKRHNSAVTLLRELNAAAHGASDDGERATKRPFIQVLLSASAGTRVKVAGLTVLGVFGLAMFCGLLTAWTFNAVLGRSAAFDPPRMAATLTLGLQTLVLPAVVIAAMFVFGSVLNLVSKLFPWPKRLWLRTWRAVLANSAAEEDEYAAVLAQVAVLVGFVAVAVVWFAFSDVVGAFVSTVSNSDLAVFAPLRPDYDARTRRVAYRLAVPALLLMVILGWLRVRRVRLTRGGTVSPWIRGAGFSLIAMLVVLSQAPYKLMLQNGMPVVLVDGQRCYQLGRLGDDIRMFCPAWTPPRVRTVTATQSRIEECRFEENVFLATTGHDCQPPSR
jgi:tRNA A-37 threonylcarbamoyl transferase component Bud32